VLTLRQFIAATAEPTNDYGADELARATILGLDVMAVILPSGMLAEDRVERMNALWNLLGEREALVVAVRKASER
jgi:hypothetical protein